MLMLGAVSAVANLFVIVCAVMCGGDSHLEKHNMRSPAVVRDEPFLLIRAPSLINMHMVLRHIV